MQEPADPKLQLTWALWKGNLRDLAVAECERLLTEDPTDDQAAAMLCALLFSASQLAGVLTPNAAAPPRLTVIIPKMFGITEALITCWRKRIGQPVAQDEPLFDISTDCFDAEIPSPATGILERIHVSAGCSAAIDTAVAVIRLTPDGVVSIRQ